MRTATASADSSLAARLDLDLDGRRLRRAWPRAADHLLLELVDPAGRRTAGQWFADLDRARTVSARTPGSSRLGRVVLQPDGADRKLIALAELMRAADNQLIAHRPERRAVVRTPTGFLKLVRPDKLARTAALARAAADLGVGAPQVLGVDPARGLLDTAALPGVPLTDLLTEDRVAELCERVGALLARLHAVPIEPAGSVAVHGPEQELAVLRRWSGLAAAHQLPAVDEASPELSDSGRRVLVHRDFHDGQLLVDGDQVGVLDFDLMAVGDPALDVANFLAQLELRSAQGRLAAPDAAAQAFVAGYRPTAEVWSAVPGYLAVARARLRAVYAFRNPEFPT